MSHFLVKQRAFLKYYLLKMIEKEKDYGWSYKEEIAKVFGYEPTPSEVYRALHDLTTEGYIYRERRKMNEDGFKEVLVYLLAHDEYSKKEKYKREVEEDIKRSIEILQKALR